MVSSAGSEFVADPGPQFNPDHAPEAPALEPEAAAELDPGWEVTQVRELLTLQGEVTHAFLRVGPEDDESWIHTEKDLKAIAPPLTRILNRYDVTKAAAAAGDEAVLVAAIGRYGARNYVRRKRLLAIQAQAGPRPVTGREAMPAPEDELEPEPDYPPTAPAEAIVQVPPPALVPKGRR